MSKTSILGPATLYGIARKYGFTGTEKEWLDLQTALRDEAKTYADNANQYMESAKQSNEQAALSAESSENSNNLSESYTHGNTGIRENEDTDNAKYYMEQAKIYKEQASSISGIDIADEENFGIVRPDNDSIVINDGILSVKDITQDEMVAMFNKIFTK